MSKVMTLSIKPINYTQSYIFKQQSSVNTWIWQKKLKQVWWQTTFMHTALCRCSHNMSNEDSSYNNNNNNNNNNRLTAFDPGQPG